MGDQRKDRRVALMMSAEELKRLDDWMFSQRIRSRAEAIRRLIAKEVGGGEQSVEEMIAKNDDEKRAR